MPSQISDETGTVSTVSELIAEMKPRISPESSYLIKFIHALSPPPASSMTTAEICLKPPNTTSSPYNKKQLIQRKQLSILVLAFPIHSIGGMMRPGNGKNMKKMAVSCVSNLHLQGHVHGGKNATFGMMDARDQFLRGVCFDFINKGKYERGPDCSYKHSLQDEGESMSTKRSQADSARSNSEGFSLHEFFKSKDCWFCLSSPSVESHLLNSIGESNYCALAKGPLVQGHVLLVPIEHLSNTLSLASPYEAELSKFQESLKMCFKNQGKEVIFFEWIQKRATHANLQAIPVPLSKASVAQNIFNLAAKKLGFSFTTTKNKNSSEGRKLLKSQFDKEHSFFYVELPDCTILSHCMEENENFPVQFGREVLAGLLNIADRADWRNCKTSKEEEMQMVADFKNRLEEFDPNR
ncbi:LOW QUALITY PROTEIN: Cwf19-like protein, C-terminal domain-2 [Dillenia turbinata]|uniref:Cwf19-like protein, C-terminal domain-2 n=1 Tax=Dillenia turbinata TaxID=194707 RepID=A0AAN8ZL04_9MAGN